MSDKQVIDITEKRELKDAKTVAEQATTDLYNSATYIQELEEQLNDANSKIKHLEELLKNANNVSDLSRKSHAEEIILVELKRMWDAHVSQNIPLDDKDSVKKLEVLVKSLVALKSGQQSKVKKEKSMSVAEALAIVKDVN